MAPIHSKAMPVILEPVDYEPWLTALWDDAAVLARLFDAAKMRISFSTCSAGALSGTNFCLIFAPLIG